MPAQIKIQRTAEGFHFDFIAQNGESILKSVTFSSLSRCKLEIQEFKAYCQRPDHLDKINNTDGRFSFLIRSKSDEPIASSNNFWSAASRDYAMQIVTREANSAVIVQPAAV